MTRNMKRTTVLVWLCTRCWNASALVPSSFLTTTVSSTRLKRQSSIRSSSGHHHLPMDELLKSEAEKSSTRLMPRRRLLQSGFAATFGSILLQATGTLSSPAVAATTQAITTKADASWMAPVQVAQLGAALEQLQQEAQHAASQVTQDLQNEYHQNGVVVIRNVVSRHWIDTLRNGCEVAQDEIGPYGEYLQQPTDAGIFFTDLELSRRLPLFSAFCQYGPCGAVAGAVMGSKSIRYLYDQLFVKENGVSTPLPWHQDGGYWRVTGSQIGSVFVPLDPVSADEGLAFVKGSQTWELHNPQHFADGTPYVGTSLPPMPDITAMAQAGRVELLQFDLQPGDVVVFSARTTHGGIGNWGRALSTRWTGDDAHFWARPGEGAVPTGNVHLRDGELLAHNSAAFPQVWSRHSEAVVVSA